MEGSVFDDIKINQMTFEGFKDAMLWVCCLAKFQLGGLDGDEESINEKQRELD